MQPLQALQVVDSYRAPAGALLMSTLNNGVIRSIIIMATDPRVRSLTARLRNKNGCGLRLRLHPAEDPPFRGMQLELASSVPIYLVLSVDQ